MSEVARNTKTTAKPQVVAKGAVVRDDDLEDLSSDEEPTGPPPVMNIGDRTETLGAMKSTWDAMADRKVEVSKMEIEDRPGADVLSNLTNAWEKGEVATKEIQKTEEMLEVDKEQFSASKNKFENITENMTADLSAKVAAIREEQGPLTGVGSDELQQNKKLFEDGVKKGPVERSVKDEFDDRAKERVSQTFKKVQDMTQGTAGTEEAEEDYALSNVPAEHNPDVVRSGLKTTDDLQQLRDLKSIKSQWETAVDDSSKFDRKTELESDVFQSGKVKSQQSRFVDGSIVQEVEENSDDEGRDPNIIRENKRKGQRDDNVRVELGSMKNKWEQGEVERAQGLQEDRTEELDSIKSGVPIKNRFSGVSNAESSVQRILEQDQLEFTSTGSARDRFAKGAAFESGPVERRDMDDTVHFEELKSVKNRFEQGVTGENETPEEKQARVQSEFQAMKFERRVKQERDRRTDEEEARQNPYRKVEQGTFGNFETGFHEADQIEGEFDVRKMVSRFRNLEDNPSATQDGAPKPKRQITPPPPDYKNELESQPADHDPNVVLSSYDVERPQSFAESKSIKERFEKPQGNQEDPEEKAKRLEQEFAMFKSMKEQMQQNEPEEEQEVEQNTEDIGIEEAHTQKLKQRWEKMERKEAKKAASSAGKQLAAAKQLPTPVAELCVTCQKRVYAAEKIEADKRIFHKQCFRCLECTKLLRLDTYSSGPDGIYCAVHYKQRYINNGRNVFDGRIPIKVETD